MGIKEQFKKLKENWVIIVLAVVLFLFVSGGSTISGVMNKATSLGGYAPNAMDYSLSESASSAYYGKSMIRQDSGNFAPEVQDRKIVKTTTISNEIERGTFSDATAKVKNIAVSSNSYILNENENKYGSGRREYKQASYQIKIETGKYDAVVAQLKEIGEVQSFNENMNDITGSYTNTQIELEAERARLAKYEKMYSEAQNINEKLDLTDRIFNQERTIKYYEDSLKNMDSRVDYSTVYLTITEKQSEYINVVIVKMSQLIQSFVSSFNGLLKLIFVLLPWAIAAAIIGFIVRLIKRRN
jgi:hypothetical protein